MKEYVEDQSIIGLHVKKKMDYVKGLNIKVMTFFYGYFNIF